MDQPRKQSLQKAHRHKNQQKRSGNIQTPDKSRKIEESKQTAYKSKRIEESKQIADQFRLQKRKTNIQGCGKYHRMKVELRKIAKEVLKRSSNGRRRIREDIKNSIKILNVSIKKLENFSEDVQREKLFVKNIIKRSYVDLMKSSRS